MNRLYVLGAGGLGREVYATALCLEHDAFLVDDDENVRRQTGALGPLANIEAPGRFIVGAGFPAAKRKLVEAAMARGLEPVGFRHPTATWMSHVAGQGVFLAAGTVVTVGVELGDHVAVLNNATVGHDSKVGSYSTICPNASISGYCEIGDDVFVGAGAVLLPKVKIGKGAIIGAGAVVTRNVRAGATVLGAPAREHGSRWW